MDREGYSLPVILSLISFPKLLASSFEASALEPCGAPCISGIFGGDSAWEDC